MSQYIFYSCKSLHYSIKLLCPILLMVFRISTVEFLSQAADGAIRCLK